MNLPFPDPSKPHDFGPLPAEPPTWHLDRLEAAADLVLTTCPHCTLRVEVVGRDKDGLARAIEEHHEPDCPNS